MALISRSVGLSEYIVSKSPDDVLVAYGLGSCLGIAIYDHKNGVAGLLHAVLPSNTGSPDTLSPKFVDSGIKLLISKMKAEGANFNHVSIRFAGGSNMLFDPKLNTAFDIGTRNTQAALETFKSLHLKINNHDTGGNQGRTVRLFVRDGKMTVRVIGKQEVEI
jgi:chemotaxis protein CheD